jgi:hypothetical protein
MERALDLNGTKRMATKQSEDLEIRRLGAALTENLRKVEQINIILQNEISEPIQW